MKFIITLLSVCFLFSLQAMENSAKRQTIEDVRDDGRHVVTPEVPEGTESKQMVQNAAAAAIAKHAEAFIKMHSVAPNKVRNILDGEKGKQLLPHLIEYALTSLNNELVEALAHYTDTLLIAMCRKPHPWFRPKLDAWIKTEQVTPYLLLKIINCLVLDGNFALAKEYIEVLKKMPTVGLREPWVFDFARFNDARFFANELMAQFLIENGVISEVACRFAIRKKDKNLCEILIKKGADVTVCANMALDYDAYELCDFFIDHGGIITNSMRFLKRTFDRGWKDLSAKILKKRAGYEEWGGLMTLPDKLNVEKQGIINVCDFLIKQGLSAGDCLRNAFVCKKAYLAAHLIDKGVTIPDAMQRAVGSNSLPVIKKLLARGVPAQEGLRSALSPVRPHICLFLIEHGASVEVLRGFNFMPALFDVCRMCDKGVNEAFAMYLLDQKIPLSLDEKDKNGCTVLFLASRIGSQRLVEKLIKRGANMIGSVETTFGNSLRVWNRGDTPLTMAVANRHTDVVRTLLLYAPLSARVGGKAIVEARNRVFTVLCCLKRLQVNKDIKLLCIPKEDLQLLLASRLMRGKGIPSNLSSFACELWNSIPDEVAHDISRVADGFNKSIRPQNGDIMDESSDEQIELSTLLDPEMLLSTLSFEIEDLFRPVQI